MLRAGIASQAGAQGADDSAEGGKFGDRGSSHQELWQGAATEQGLVWAGQRCLEKSGDFLRARLGLGPGCLALGVACPWGARPRRGVGGVRYSLLDGSRVIAVVPTSGWGWDSGGLGQGGRAGGDSCCR